MALGNSPGPLEGIRVLDLGTMMACPYGATLLGDLGADVIKVESKAGDDSRHMGPQREGERTPFLSLNRNKRGLVLDLRKENAQGVLSKLVKSADVVITNTREPALTKLGTNYEQLKAHREDIIWIGITSFGPDGPYAGRPGIDFLAQGYAGLLSLNGEPDQPPVRVTVPLVDTMTSIQAALAAVTAVHHRGKTGEGQRIDISLLDVLMHAQCSSVGSYLVGGEVTPRTGNRSQYFAPSGIYPTQDGKGIVITCPSQKFFGFLCKTLGVDWATDPRFENIEGRLENQDELDRLLGQACQKFDRDDLVEKLVAGDLLTAPIQVIPEVVEDPQVVHNEMIVNTQHASIGELPVTGVPIKFRGTPGSVRRAPPVHGEHTEELLSELGYADEEISQLRKDGDVVTPAESRFSRS